MHSEEDIVIGAKTDNTKPKSDPLAVEKNYSREDFQTYFSDKTAFQTLVEKSLKGGARNMTCRWSAWKAFIGMFTVGDEKKAREELRKSRDYYAKELDTYTNYRKNQMDADPLSGSSKNPWNNFFEDSELKNDIKKDIERTHQDREFFTVKKIQDILTNILFVWSKQNADLGYRQGMNEIVALLTWVAYHECFKAENPKEDFYDYLNDEKYVEHDVYTFFKKIMSLSQKDMFSTNPVAVPGRKKVDKVDANGRPNTPIVHRAVHIQEGLLPYWNEVLAGHFKHFKVEPQIYLLEFSMDDSIPVWDAVYAFHYSNPPKTPTLEMIDYICLGMLHYIADDLLGRDDGGTILGRLLKYPAVEDISVIIALANEARETVKNNMAKPKQGERMQELEEEADKSPEKKPTPTTTITTKTSENAEDKKNVILFNPNMSLFKGKGTSPSSQNVDVKRGDFHGASAGNPLGEAAEKPKILPKKKEKDEPVIFTASETFTLTREKPKETIKPVPITAPSNKESTSSLFQSLENHTKHNFKEVKKSIEDKNHQAVSTIKSVIDLLKSESQENPSMNLQKAIADLSEALDKLKDQGQEIRDSLVNGK